MQDRAMAVMGNGPFSAALFAARLLRMVFDAARTVFGARRVEALTARVLSVSKP